MKIKYGLSKIKKFRNPVVALGVFDGVHRGHREILRAAVERARQIKGKCVVITFWPHPQGEKSIFSLKHRLLLLEELGVNVVIVINFTKDFADMKAEDFIREVLVKKIGAAYVYIGNNFRFGKGASGSLKLLQGMSKEYGFKTGGFRILKSGGRPISSTLIRSLIKKGELREAQNLLQHPVSVLGSVIRGTALGRIMGFPTANIDPHHEIIPPSGIYAVRVVLGKKRFEGACYIGQKPSVRVSSVKCQVSRGVSRKVCVEVHILNFNKNIYGKYLEIQFVKKIRPDKKFASLKLLSEQIRKDIAVTKKILS